MLENCVGSEKVDMAIEVEEPEYFPAGNYDPKVLSTCLVVTCPSHTLVSSTGTKVIVRIYLKDSDFKLANHFFSLS